MSSSSQFKSVLDTGSRDPGAKVHADRITRHRSPSRPRDGDEEIVIPRVSQPYRTSLSAVAAPVRIKKSDRSRSVSPGSSLADASSRSRSKSPGQRRSSPKHVTYDERVTVRHSDTEDSIVTDLSGKDSSLERSPQQTALKVDMEYLSLSPRTTSQDSVSYSAQLRQTSSQMLEVHSLTPSPRSYTSSSPSGVLKDSLQVSPSMCTPNGSTRDGSTASPVQGSPGKGDSGVYTDGESSSKRGKVNIEKDYSYDRTISYRQAIQAHYSQEVRNLAESNVEEICPQNSLAGAHSRSPVSPSSEICPRTERSNTMPTNTITDDKNLTVSKKSVGSSIGSFFRKISPRMSRREGKRGKSSRSSTSGSAQSLDASTGESSESNQSNDSFTRSRSKGRLSFLRIIGGSRSRSRSKSEQDEHSSTSKSPKSPKHAEIVSHQDHTSPTNMQLPSSTNRILKSIEQNAVAEKTIYQKFKEKQTTPGRPGDKTLTVKSHAMKTSPETTPTSTMVRTETQMNKENELTSTTSASVGTDCVCEGNVKADPPRTLNVRPVVRPLAKSSHSPFVSAASVDDSIGDCSLDINMEGGEPSLLTVNGHASVSGSKQVILSQDNLQELCPTQSQCTQNSPPRLEISRPSENYSVRERVPQTTTSTGGMHLSQGAPVIRLENGALSGYSSTSSDIPQLSDSNSCEISPRDYKRIPSYLKLSCAVSGYGRYSSYSSRKNIELRSHGASTSSLRSDGSSTDETGLRTVDRTSSLPVNFHRKVNEIEHIGRVNGQITDYVSNGHTEIYPTGDQNKDGQYYLDACQTEEERLLILCARAQDDMVQGALPEEANGRIRAAIGKTNLVITKKFKQFRGLCQKHMKPEGADRPTKWEDLQGYWDMVKIQIDDLDELFAEIAFMRQNEWKDVPRKIQSARSSANSSPKSPSLSLSCSSTPSATPGHTPGHTPAARRKPVNLKDTTDSSPEKSQKAKQTAKAREEARKNMLMEKRAAMKQKKLQEQQNNVVEIFLADSSSKN